MLLGAGMAVGLWGNNCCQAKEPCGADRTVINVIIALALIVAVHGSLWMQPAPRAHVTFGAARLEPARCEVVGRVPQQLPGRCLAACDGLASRRAALPEPVPYLPRHFPNRVWWPSGVATADVPGDGVAVWAQ